MNIKKILIIIILLFIFNTLKNYIILSKIYNKQTEYKNCTNYSYKKLEYSTKINQETIVTDIYCKDGKFLVIKSNDDKIWYDKKTNESITLPANTKNAIITNEDVLEDIEFPIDTSKKTFMNKLILAMHSFIFSKKINNESCYYIKKWFNSKTYISKKTYVPIKIIGHKKILIDGKKYNSIIEITNWSTDTLTEDDVSNPNLDGYNIIQK